MIDANLDCESRWSGLSLSAAVRSRISLYGGLLSALAPDADIELWTPAAIDPSRWLGRSIEFRAGTPANADLRWAQPAAKAANDRRLAHRVARELGIGLRGAYAIESESEQQVEPPRPPSQEDLVMTGGPFELAPGFAPGGAGIDPTETPLLGGVGLGRSISESAAFRGRWIAKAAWTAAGRDRVIGNGPPTDEQRTRLGRLLAACSALVVEPYCDRMFDFGVCATVDATGVHAQPPHSLLVDQRGGFVGIDLAEPPLDRAERELVDRAVEAAGKAIAQTGYHGPFAVDGFVYRDGDQRRVHPLCEINARYSFGWVARAFGKRLGFSPAPAGATTLIAPGADGVTAWIA